MGPCVVSARGILGFPDPSFYRGDRLHLNLRGLQSLTNKIASAPVDGGEVNNVLGNSVNLKLPEFKIANFADNSKNPFDFFIFYSSFDNALNRIQGISKTVKLVYLKAYLYGRALQLVENLPIEDDSYDIAWNLLKSEFFDKDLLVNDTLSSIINWPYNESLEQTMKFITYLKSKLFELKKFDLDFLKENSAGEILLSNIVQSKLCGVF